MVEGYWKFGDDPFVTLGDIAEKLKGDTPPPSVAGSHRARAALKHLLESSQDAWWPVSLCSLLQGVERGGIPTPDGRQYEPGWRLVVTDTVECPRAAGL